MATYLTCPLIGADPTLPLMGILAMNPDDQKEEAASLCNGYGHTRFTAINEELMQSTAELLQTTCEDTLTVVTRALLPGE